MLDLETQEFLEAQGLTVCQIAGNGELLVMVDDDMNSSMVKLIYKAQREKDFSLLHYIDFYGNTVFNQLQLPDLFIELEKLQHLSDDKENEHLKKVLSLVSNTRDATHTYIKFIGD